MVFTLIVGHNLSDIHRISIHVYVGITRVKLLLPETIRDKLKE